MNIAVFYYTLLENLHFSTPFRLSVTVFHLSKLCLNLNIKISLRSYLSLLIALYLNLVVE